MVKKLKQMADKKAASPASLFDGEEGYDLVWSRPRPKDKAARKAPAE